MTSMDLEIVDLTEIVGDHEIACEYATEPYCPDDPARWVMFLKPCCPAGSGIRLACTHCKDNRLMAGNYVQCEFCSHVEHAPEAYSRIEPLERK